MPALVANVNRLPAIYFRSTQDNDPVVPRRVALDELSQDITTQRSSTEHGQNFERYHAGVRDAPTCIRTGIFSPCGYRSCKEGKRATRERTHLGKDASARIDRPSKCGEIYEGPFEGEMDHGIKCLSTLSIRAPLLCVHGIGLPAR